MELGNVIRPVEDVEELIAIAYCYRGLIDSTCIIVKPVSCMCKSPSFLVTYTLSTVRPQVFKDINAEHQHTV